MWHTHTHSLSCVQDQNCRVVLGNGTASQEKSARGVSSSDLWIQARPARPTRSLTASTLPWNSLGSCTYEYDIRKSLLKAHRMHARFAAGIWRYLDHQCSPAGR
jgi:hypothetical protein